MGRVRSARPVVVVCAVTALVVVALTAREGIAVAHVAEACLLAAAVSALCASAFFYVRWHIDADPGLAWLVAVSAAFALQKLNWFILVTEDSPQRVETAWCYAFQIALALALGTVLVRGDRTPLHLDPLAAGMLLGFGVIVARLAVLALPGPALSETGHTIGVAALCLAWLANAVRLLRSTVLDAELRRRVAVCTVLISVGEVATTEGSSPALMALGAVMNASGGALLVTAAVVRARRGILEELALLRVLRRQLEAVEQDLHTDQARRHEIRATLAGIATATDLLHRTGISTSRREQLHDMTAAELQRLDRLVGERSSIAPAPIELDDVLRPVIVRHEASGLPIRWRPSGHIALARADDVAEIISVLLANARRHAGPTPVRVDVSGYGEHVEVAVTDSGPGVDPAVLPSLFTWGAHSPHSPGEGVGLAAAKLMAEQLDGDLRLVPTARGARFVLTLPAALPAMVRSSRR